MTKIPSRKTSYTYGHGPLINLFILDKKKKTTEALILNSETGFCHTPPLEGKIATDTFTPSPAPVVYKISGPMGGGFSYTTGAEAENSAVKLSKESVPPLYKNRSSINHVHDRDSTLNCRGPLRQHTSSMSSFAWLWVEIESMLVAEERPAQHYSLIRNRMKLMFIGSGAFLGRPNDALPSKIKPFHAHDSEGFQAVLGTLRQIQYFEIQ